MYIIEIKNANGWVTWPEGEEPEVFTDVDLAHLTAEGIPLDELAGRELRIDCSLGTEVAA